MKTYPEFSSLEALNKYIEQYERANYVQLWKRDCKTLSRMKAVCPKKLTSCNMELYYYSITYACTKGGKQFKSTGKGLRKTLTYKENCPMKINVRISDDGQTLKVLSIDDKHNHYVEKEFFEALPKQRRKYNGNIKRPTKLIKRLKGYKKSVRSYLEDTSEKQILSKDYKNSRRVNLSLKSDLDDVIKLLIQDNGFAHVATTEEGELVGMYYQSLYMKKCFSAYPEVILLDDTYKLQTNMPLYFIMSINGNNEADVCCIFLITEEPASMIRHMLNVFKTNNTEWKNIKTFLTDKDFGEKSVLHEEFPITVHQSCVLSDLKNSFAFDLFKIPTGTVHGESSIFKSFYEKVEEFCKSFSNTESFFENIIVLLDTVKQKRKETAEAMMSYNNKDGVLFSPHVEAYRRLVTPYAFKLIKEQIEDISKQEVYDTNVSYIIQNEDNPGKQFIVSKSDNKTCTCEFNETNNLPCSHIFSVIIDTCELFNKDLIPERFLNNKYIETYKDVEETRQKVVMSTEQKLEIASERCKTLASIISNCNRHSFANHIDQLNQLIEAWSQGQETNITVLQHGETIVPRGEEEELETEIDSHFKDEELCVDDSDSFITDDVDMLDIFEQESQTVLANIGEDTELPNFDDTIGNRTNIEKTSKEKGFNSHDS